MRSRSGRRTVRAAAAAALLAGAFAGPGQALAAPRDLVGKKAPEAAGTLLSGEVFDLAAFRGKVPVILTFWSIYCKSCTEEMSALQRLYEKYGPEKVAVVAVNEDAEVGLGRVRNFLDRFSAAEGRLTFPILFDGKEEVFRKFGVVHLPTLVYVDREGTVREVIEGFERGREFAVIAAIEKLVGEVAPETLVEVASEAVFDLDAVAPVCGIYRDGAWYRPLDLDESGRPEAVDRATSAGEDHLRREAIRLALGELGISLLAPPRPPTCTVPYGNEIRTPVRTPDALDLLLARLNVPRVLETASQETVERPREILLYRRYKVDLQALRDQLGQAGYSTGRTEFRIRFVRASFLEERLFVESLMRRYPYLGDFRRIPATKGRTDYLLVSHALPEKAVEALRSLDVGANRLSIDLLPGDIAEVAIWR